MRHPVSILTIHLLSGCHFASVFQISSKSDTLGRVMTLHAVSKTATVRHFGFGIRYARQSTCGSLDLTFKFSSWSNLRLSVQHPTSKSVASRIWIVLSWNPQCQGPFAAEHFLKPVKNVVNKIHVFGKKWGPNVTVYIYLYFTRMNISGSKRNKTIKQLNYKYE